MMVLIRFLGRFIRRHWFPLILAGIAFYVVFQKELRVVLYFQKPEPVAVERGVEEMPSAPAGVVREDSGGGMGIGGHLMSLFSWGVRQATPVGRQAIPVGRQAQPIGQAGEAELVDGRPAYRRPDWVGALRAVSREDQLAYLKRFARVAVAERKKFGLPSSLILAVSLLHSTAGRAEPAVRGNNHFALPCTDLWEGSRQEIGGRCYRAYENAWTSFRDFSLYASSLPATTKPEATDCEGWMGLLEKSGFASGAAWKEEVRRIIQEFQLYELDVK